MTDEPAVDALGRQLFEFVPDPLFLMAPEGVFLDLNRAAAKYLGRAREELVGRSVDEIFPPDQAARQKAVVAEVFASGISFSEERVTPIGGETFVFRYTLRRAEDQDGKPLGVLGMVTDVTGLVALQRCYAELYEKATEALFAVDTDGRIRTVNRNAETLSGYSRDVVESLHFSEVVPPEETERLRGYFRDRLEGREAPTEYELRFLHADGTQRWAEVHISREPSSLGAFQASVRDISARKHLEALRRDFLQMISHDIKTPLTVIHGFAGGLVNGLFGDLAPQQASCVANILSASRRIRHLVEQFLYAERLEGEEQLPPLSGPARAVVHEACTAAGAEARAKGVALEVDADGLETRRVADREALQRILENLLSNAVKFTPAGGRIDVRGSVEEGQLRLEVEDTGVGVPEAELPRVFDRFFRASTSGGTWGSGLGLHIVRRLAERLGGRVAAESAPGRGARFTVWLPEQPR
jgi:PAS domain S-box-containing protein